MITAQLVALFVRLQKPECRREAATDLAVFAGLDKCIVFANDPKSELFFTPLGFKQISAENEPWQTFLKRVGSIGMSSALLIDPETHEETPVFGVSDADNHCVLVFFGGMPETRALTAINTMLPLLGAKLACERDAAMASSHAARVVDATQRADALHEQLERMKATGSARDGLHIEAGQQTTLTDAKVTVRKASEELNKALDMSRVDLQVAYERAEQELAYRREAENKLRLADRRKDEFIATISHELRTPLNAVLGWAELLRMRSLVDPQVNKGIEAIIRSAKTQVNLINDLLDTSSIVAGKIVLHIETFDLADVLERARETVEPLASQKNITIRADYALKESMQGDSARLRQVFWNLLCNAIKFTPNGGSIAIRARSDGVHAQVAIVDTGMGIEEGFLPYVFERFRQADPSLRRKYGGLGLGLSIAKQFVEMHGGSIQVTSDGIDKGTTFLVSLPHTASEFGLPGESPGSSEEFDLHYVRALAVDDDPDARDVVSQILSSFGIQVTVTDSALHALQLLETEEFDVLLSDIAMPYMDGIAFMTQVRAIKDPIRAMIPALALTAFSDAARFTQARSAGFNVVMTKPVLAMDLARSITRLLYKK